MMFNLDQDSTRRILKSPSDAHSFRERFQMMKANFKPVTIDDLFRGPGNGNTGACCGHHHNVAVGALFEITNVAIVRQNLWPQFKVRRGLENRHLRRIHNDGVGLVHWKCCLLSDGKPPGYRCCASSAEQRILPRKTFRRKEKIRPPSIQEHAVAGGDRSAYCYSKGKGIEPLPLARARTTRLRVRPSATFSIIWCLADPAVTWLNHDRAWRDLLGVPADATGQRRQVIDL